MRSVRLLFVVLSITIVLLALAAVNAHGVMAAPASPDSVAPVPVDTLPFVTAVRIGPPPPCATCAPPAICPNVAIPLHIEGTFPNRCWMLRAVQLLPGPPTFAPAPPIVRLLVDDGACRAGLCPPLPRGFAVDTLLPPLPGSSQQLTVQVATVSCSDSIPPGHLFEARYPFTVAVDCSTGGDPLVAFSTLPVAPCGTGPVSVLARLLVCPPCANLLSASFVPGLGLLVRYEMRDLASCSSPAGCRGDSAVVPLGTLTAGNYTVATTTRRFNMRSGAPFDSVDTPGTFSFSVSAACTPVPWPIPLDARVFIDGQVASDSTAPRTCAGKLIPVRVRGEFPNACGRIRKVELIPSLLTVIGPPTLRILLDSGECLHRLCSDTVTPWEVDTVLPALPRGSYRFNVVTAQVSCSDSIVDDRVLSRVFPFAAVDSCPPPAPACLWAEWGPSLDGTVCHAMLAPGGTADVEMEVASGAPLAGLQGTLRTDSSLVIRQLAPIGPAAGMSLQWTSTADGGARFVMFATHGAPIPQYPPPDSSHRIPGVLRVTVAAAPGHDVPERAHVMADTLFGADSLARLVGACFQPFPWAIVCRGSSCDVNGDGVADVRDLVLMVHCILRNGPCADTTAGRFDCDGNGLTNLDDVLCCARAILHGGVRDSVAGRDEPAVSLAFGELAKTADGVSVPVTLQGADRVGALRMALRYPADRYEVSALTGGGADWLALSEVQGDEVVVGLIGLGAPPAGASVPLTLQLKLKAGAEHGGEVTVTSADVSAPDGAKLATSLVGNGATITAPLRVTLAVQPNPFDASGTTLRFTLPKAAQVELAVYDVAGRRVATVVDAALPAGTHASVWRADGALAGVYFVRLRADGVELAHKAVLMRGR